MAEVPDWRDELHKLLEDHEYESSQPMVGRRKPMTHHIDGLMDDLVPFIEETFERPAQGVEEADLYPPGQITKEGHAFADLLNRLGFPNTAEEIRALTNDAAREADRTDA